MITACQQKLINQAKELLITREHVSESQAHRLIQKRSMNLRISKLECATQIIARYNQPLGEDENTLTNRNRTKTFAQGDNHPLTSVFFNAKNNAENNEKNNAEESI